VHELIDRPVSDSDIASLDWQGSAHLPSAASVRRTLVWVAGAIVVLGWLREWLRLGYGIEGTSFFNLNREQNLGAWFSATMLAACAVLLLNAGRRARAAGQRWGWFWFVLSAVFVALSIDEASSVHEMLMDPIHDSLNSSGLFKYAWVIPALVLVPAFALSSVPFLLSLPRRTAAWFVVSGALYVSGALGFEMLEGLTDGVGPTFVLLYLVEETLEIAGIVAFFFALMDHLSGPSAILPE
jgi:hypothetical protein